MNLIPANRSDIHLIERLGKKTYRQHFSAIWSDQGIRTYLENQFSEQALQAQLATPYIRYYIPMHKKVPAGIVKIKVASQLPVHPFDRGLELEKIYLLENFTGLGIGKRILEASLAIALENHQEFLWLDVLKTNINAKRLYEREAFQTVGEISFSTDIRKIDMWILRKDLFSNR